MRRIARRSSGWSTTEAMVERMRAGEGLRGRLRLETAAGRSELVGSMAVYINMR
jgi:hypothetical protein